MKIISAILFAAVIISCSKKEPVETNFNEVATEQISMPESGKDLIEGSDCVSCHQLNERLIGPSYSEIAARYTEKDIEMLAGKIISGSKGTWGEIAMPAHLTVSEEQAKKMVQYILSQKLSTAEQ